MKKEIIKNKNINDWQINTNNGFVDFNGIIKTNQQDIINIKFDNNSNLRCSPDHRLFDINGQEILSKNLKIGNHIKGKNDKLVEIIDILYENKKENMYDILDVKNSTNSYLTNNILSHNCEFLGSSKTLISSKFLEAMNPVDPIDYKFEKLLKIFENPIPGHEYVMGVDVAKGTGGDYSVVQVLDITKFPIKQVAVYRNNLIRTRPFSLIIEKIGIMYNDAYLMIENNDIGHGVVDLLWNTIEYENMVNFSFDKKNKNELGIRSTKKSKSLACDLVKDMVEEYNINIYDIDTIYELSNFTEVREGIFQGEEGEHDDLVTAMLWAIFILKTRWIDKEEMEAKRDIEEESNYDEPLEAIVERGEGEINRINGFEFHNI